jgi:tyrosine-protein kinase Etk/Wzc
MQSDRAAIDQALQAQPGTGQVVDGLAAVPTVAQSPRLQQAVQEAARKQAELRELRARYTDEAAPVVALRQQIDSLEGTVIPGLARQLQSELTTREVMVRPRVNAAMGSLRRLPVLALDETRLARDVAGAAQLADEVRQRYESARLALYSSLPDVRVLDNAMTPSRPMASLGPMLIALAFLTSLAVAVMVSLLREGLDPKVRYPEQVTQGMRLQILAAMPHVSWRLGEDGSAPVIEALRGLRLRVLQTHTDAGPLVLTITSPAMGEGKSFISSNLALSFADAGYRTILVDGDVRRGAQHLALDAQQRPGLTDVLSGRSALGAAIQDTGFPSLQLVAAGSRMHRAPELLLSPRMKSVIDELRSLADVIIVDSPPLAAGVDPVALGTVTGNLMLVLRQGTTDMPMAMQKLDLLEQFPIRTIGAVLNDVPERGAFKYYTYEPDESEFLPSGEDDDGDRKRPPILAGKGPES